MIQVDIPGGLALRLRYLVLDYNGTLACDGEMLAGVREALTALAGDMAIHVLTADTFGKARAGLRGITCELAILPPHGQAESKARYVKGLGGPETACIGNGRNDRLMMEEAALGIAVVQEEGASVECVTAARVVCRDVREALDLLRHPLRLTATLRD